MPAAVAAVLEAVTPVLRLVELAERPEEQLELREETALPPADPEERSQRVAQAELLAPEEAVRLAPCTQAETAAVMAAAAAAAVITAAAAVAETMMVVPAVAAVPVLEIT